MKKLIAVIGAVLLLAVTTHAQTNTTTGTSFLSQLWSDLGSATNFAVVPYGSYGLNNHKVGGGALALYNFNNYVGAGIGADYMGQFSLVTANIELKLPTHPLSFVGWTNFTATPFVYSGIGTPMSGAGTANGGISTHLGAGANVDLLKALGGEISVGGAYVARTGAGDYSGKYLNVFLAWRHGF